MMRRVSSLSEFVQSVEDRKHAIGITDHDIARARNSGARRTRAKRDLLAKIRKRTLAQGLTPFPANF